MSFLTAFTNNINKYPDKVALEFIDPPLQKFTYAELDELIQRTMVYLSDLGVEPGDRVALQLTKSLDFILLHLATVRLGAITLPLNLAYPPEELKYFLSDSGAKLFFALETSKDKISTILSELPDLQDCIFLDPSEPDQFNSLIADKKKPIPDSQLPEIDLQDTAIIIYTSGTTGRPKGAEITHGNIQSNLEALHTAWGWRSDDVLLHILPIFHVHGLFVAMHGALHAGATTQMMRTFDERITLKNLVERKCTVLMAVPTIHRRLISVPDPEGFDLSHVRLITSGSDRLPDEVFTGFQKIFGHTLLERYGMTETGMNCSNPLHGERRIGSVGLPLPGVEVRIAGSESGKPLPDGEIGDLQLRGPNVFSRYWRQPEKTSESFSEDGWFQTGDLGYREPDGYITLCGRSKDLIISGGLNIYPPEVERVLVEHPAVGTCAVIGCPDDEWGESVTAIVVLGKDKSVSETELIAFCRERLATFKSPKSIIFHDALPRNAMGKVQKVTLRNKLCR